MLAVALNWVGACSLPKGSITAQTSHTSPPDGATDCSTSGQCILDPTGLAQYNPDLFTKGFVLRSDLPGASSLHMASAQADTPVVLIADELAPHVRGAVMVSASEPCGSPLAIKDPNPTLAQLRSFRDGRYKTCLAYIGESMERKVMEMEPVSIDASAPVPSGSILVENIRATAATITWTLSTDNLTLTNDLSYQVYTATSGPLDSLTKATTSATPVAGRVVGGTSQALSGLTPTTRYYAAVIVSDEAGNRAFAGHTTFVTASAAIGMTLHAPTSQATPTSDFSFDIEYTSAGEITYALTPSKITINKTGTANASIKSITGTGPVLTITLTSISGTGYIGISILHGSAIDAAGFGAPAIGPSSTLRIDTDAPTASSVSSNPASPGNTRTPQVSFTLDETTSAFSLVLHTDASCSSPVSAAATGAAGVNTVALTSLPQDNPTNIYARLTDLRGNTACRSLISYSYDGIQPGVTVSSDADPGPTNLSNLTLTFEFTENVTGFTAGDILLTNATAGTFTAVDANTYTLAITATGSPVQASVAAGSAVDAAQNLNTGSNAWSIVREAINTCTWTGAVSTSFTENGNWSGCASAPSTSNKIIVPSAPANQPVLSANRTIAGFAEAVGGGTITINSGVTLTVNGNIESSIAIKGSTTNCSSCVLYRGSNLYVLKDATLTLMEGSTVELSNGSSLYLGNGTTSAGHLTTNIATSSIVQWPLIGTAATDSGAQMRLFVQGTAATRSRLSINGLRMKAKTGHAISLTSNYEVNQIDQFRVTADKPWTDFRSPAIGISSCTGAQFNDTTWTDLQFADVNKKTAIETPATTCASMPAITVSGSGFGFGEPFESDQANKITWTDGAVNATPCEWTGATSTDWSTTGNWTNCGGNAPNQLNWIVVPSAATNQPRLSGRAAVYGFAAGSGGGTITVAANSRLNIIASASNIQSNITLTGESAYCPTCEIGSASGLQVVNGATLTLGTDITVRCNGSVKAGTGTSAGHITAAGTSDSARWPTVTTFSNHNDTGSWAAPLIVQGTTTTPSKISFDGIKIHGGYDNAIVDFKSDYEILKMDNVYFDNAWSANSTGAISLSTCTNATITDTTWNGIYFDVGNLGASIRNIGISHTSCSGIPSLNISGGGRYYGAAYATDTHSKIAWSSNSCGGYTHASHCWYLSNANESCASRCSLNGGHSPATMYAGNAFGRGNEHQLESMAGISCPTIISSLVGTSLSASTSFTNSNAIGCSVNAAGTPAREFDLKPTADAVDASYRRACACMN